MIEFHIFRCLFFCKKLLKLYDKIHCYIINCYRYHAPFQYVTKDCCVFFCIPTFKLHRLLSIIHHFPLQPSQFISNYKTWRKQTTVFMRILCMQNFCSHTRWRVGLLLLLFIIFICVCCSRAISRKYSDYSLNNFRRQNTHVFNIFFSSCFQKSNDDKINAFLINNFLHQQ